MEVAILKNLLASWVVWFWTERTNQTNQTNQN